MRENYQGLYEIVKAVRNGRAAKARLLAQDHMKRFNRFMEEKNQEQGKV